MYNTYNTKSVEYSMIYSETKREISFKKFTQTKRSL